MQGDAHRFEMQADTHARFYIDVKDANGIVTNLERGFLA